MSSSQSAEASSIPLLNLPAEVLLHSLSFLSFSSLAAFRQTSSFSHRLVTASSELLYRRLSFTHGLTDERTCGSSTGVKGGSFGLDALSEQFDPDELKKAVRAQRAFSEYFVDVCRWEEFGECCSRGRKSWSG
jgi:hypothetical protein